MKTTIYRYSDQDTVRVIGRYPGYGLEDIGNRDLEWCDPIEVELPEGYGTVACGDGRARLQDPNGRVCELVANGDCGFWIMPTAGGGDWGLYVHIGEDDAATASGAER